MRALGALVISVGLFSADAASATTLVFGGCVSNNNATDCATGGAQLSVTVSSSAPQRVEFIVTNSGPLASSITDIYFDDGTLLGIASVTNSAGVSFSQGASPGNLPAGRNASPSFVATAGFAADSNAPVQINGVNPGEWVTIAFDLQGGGTLQDVLDELADGRLRIGVHVQGFAGGGSESFVNTPLPEPGALALLTTAGVAALLRRRAR